MRKCLLVPLTLLLIAGLLFSFGCPAPTPPQEKPPLEEPEIEEPVVFPIIITDGLGRMIKFEEPPKRIVSIAPSTTEILFALGLDNEIVGVTAYCNYPEKAKTKRRVGGYYPPDIERIVEVEPDLIVASKEHEKEVLPVLERLGLTTVVLVPRSLEDILQNIVLLGRITGKVKAASQLVDELSKRIEAITSKTENLSQEKRLRVFYVFWHDPLWTAGGEVFSDDLIRKAGGVNIFAADFSEFRIVSLEEVVKRNPQVIIVSGMGATKGLVLRGIKDEPRLRNVEAIIKGQVYEIDSDLVDRPGPRIVEGLERVAKYLYPELF